MKTILGSKVKDSINGLVGIAVARTEYLHGCARVAIAREGLDSGGKTFEDSWVDEPRLERQYETMAGFAGITPPNND
jgi:hypothetical protein